MASTRAIPNLLRGIVAYQQRAQKRAVHSLSQGGVWLLGQNYLKKGVHKKQSQ